MKKLVLAVSVLAALVLTGCADAEVPAEEPKASEAAPEPAPEPEPDLLPVSSVGDTLELSSATIVVNILEQRDVVESAFPDFTPNFVPANGERLWYFDMTWTNNLSEAVSKECHGPNAVSLDVFDRDGNQMLMVDQPGHIVGQNCSTGLLTGQSGTWLTAFRGLDADFGWAVFSDRAGGEVIVTLDPGIQLARTQ